MFCENCGKQLIRGYQFCMECGTPVPPEKTEEAPAENNEENAGTSGRKLPSVEPINNEDGSLVYCPNCGMHMQTSNVFCEKCGTRLGNQNDHTQGAPVVNNGAGSVPLWNAQPQSFGDNLSDYSDDDLDRINNFMSGNSDADDYSGVSGGGIDEIEALTQQLANFGASASEMPEIGSVHSRGKEPTVRHQQEPAVGESRKVDDFSMLEDTINSYENSSSVSDSGLPVIEGASMDEDPSQDVSLDPYAFVNNVIDNTPYHTPENPSYSEPVSETPSYSEPVSETPSYSEPVSETPSYSEPVSETPSYSEPVSEAPSYSEAVSETPSYSEPVSEEPTEDYFENEAPFMAEVAPVIEETPVYNTPDATAAEEPSPAEYPTDGTPHVPADTAAKDTEAPRGNLVYCRNCGQDMYDTEPFCKNCGAPYKGAYIPPRNAPSKGGAEKRPVKKWIPISAAAVVVVGLVIVLVATSSRPSDNGNVVGNSSLPVTSSTSSEQSEPDSSTSSADESEVTSEVTSDTTDTSDTSRDEDVNIPVVDDDPDESSSDDNSAPDESSVPEEENSDAPSSSTSGTTHTTRTTSRTTATTKTTTRTTAATTTSHSNAAAAITSGKVKSLEKDRQAITDAAATIAGEIGKIDMFAQNVIYAIDNSSGSADTARTAYYNRDFAKNMINIIKSGKSTVDNAVSGAEPANSEMDAAYSSLKALKRKYDAYYNYVITPSGKASKFSTESSNYLSDFTSYLSSNMKYTKMITSDYSTSDTNTAYSNTMSDAVTAANNAVSSLTTLQTKITDLGSKKFEGSVISELSKNSVTKTYANAAAYTMRVRAYGIMLDGAPSSYSTAHSYLNSANNTLSGLVDSYSMIQENSFSNYKSESSDAISNAKSYISSVTRAIS